MTSTVNGAMISAANGKHDEQVHTTAHSSAQSPGRGSYALATAAYNEEKLIGKVIQAIVEQTVKPEKWVIVNDGSSDRTAEIIQSYAEKFPFIEMYTVTEEHPRDLTAQVHAINKGFSRLKELSCEFVGNLDADVTLEPTYFETLLARFEQDPRLGLAGGFIYEEKEGEFQIRKSNVTSSVAHAVQLFRRECLEELGGYRPFSWAGADWYAEVSLRMKGWNVHSIPDLRAFHHRPTGKGFGLYKYAYRGGKMDFYMGTHPLFEIVKMTRRLLDKPYVVAAAVRFSGFLSGYWKREPRQVPREFMAYLRKEQMERLRSYFLGSQKAS
jgi:biofilm PGA synthesis N-glycosyltransferase PgaC